MKFEGIKAETLLLFVLKKARSATKLRKMGETQEEMVSMRTKTRKDGNFLVAPYFEFLSITRQQTLLR